ncbi:type II secretion system F family protein [Fastidiosibacter lacustris]|uniref:type II secretion system F family protein n=1 Tax=Fastidiosibacter lacustris TaxID=2056695 RepID=UPI000E355CA3|nr:type II secretion system F family protein [Fastidiosibacter lacustris]
MIISSLKSMILRLRGVRESKKQDTSKKYNMLMVFVLRLFFSNRVRASLYQNIILVMSNSSLSIYGTLVALKEKYQYYRSFNNKVLATILQDWITKIEYDGMTFDEAIKPYIPENEHMMIKANFDNPINALDYASSLTQKFALLAKKIAIGMIMPTISILVLIGVIVGCSLKVIPMLLESLPKENLSGNIADFIALNDYITGHTWHIILLAIVLFIMLPIIVKRWTFNIRYHLFDKLWGFAEYKRIQATSVLISLASLLSSGKSFNMAFMLIENNCSHYLKQYISKIRLMMSQDGVSAGRALASVNLFNNNTSLLLDIYTDTGAIEQGLLALSERVLETEIEAIVTKMKMIGFIILSLSMSYIGFFYFSVATLSDSMK